MCMIPSADSTTTIYVAHDLDAAWEQLGPYMLHRPADVRVVARRRRGREQVERPDHRSHAGRAGRAYRVLTPAEAVESYADTERSHFTRCVATTRTRMGDAPPRRRRSAPRPALNAPVAATEDVEPRLPGSNVQTAQGRAASL